ncbi:antitoxin Xre/MbcA/ParS toxin-binding domain-containing protein [Glaciimonas sp. GG7]
MQALRKSPETSEDAEKVLSKAVLKAANILNINQAVMAKILGISTPTASRLFNGHYHLSTARKSEWDLAILFVRVFRSLDALIGHGDGAKAWLSGYNKALNARPIDLIISIEGIVHVLNYLDAYRGRI